MLIMFLVLIAAVFGLGSSQLLPDQLGLKEPSNSNSGFGVNSPNGLLNASCGSLVEDDTWFGVISYKPFEKVSPHERCVWAIRGKTIDGTQTSGFGFTFYNLDVDNMNLTTGVIITVFDSQGYHSDFYPKEKDQYYQVHGNMALVTFYSGDSQKYRGFSLNYTRISGWWVDPVSFNSKDVILSEPSGYIYYPPYEFNSTLGGNELSTFIITPNFRHNPSQILNVDYLGWGFENCDDYLDVFGFSRSIPLITNTTLLNSNVTTSHWRHYGKICEREQEALFSNEDMMLFVFHSNSNYNSTGAGFSLSYQRFPKPLYDNIY